MSEFAKLFGSGDDQIVVLLQGSDDAGPEVRVFYQPKELGVCSFALGFDDSDEGWDRAEEAFRKSSEEWARRVIAKTLKELGLDDLHN